jgi:hypothetical protein
VNLGKGILFESMAANGVLTLPGVCERRDAAGACFISFPSNINLIPTRHFSSMKNRGILADVFIVCHSHGSGNLYSKPLFRILPERNDILGEFL